MYYVYLDALSAIIHRITDLRSFVATALQAAVDGGRFADASRLASLADAISRLPVLDDLAPERAADNLQEGTQGESDLAVSGLGDEPYKYPFFLQSQGALVKVGWSPRSSDEYRHRVDATAIERIAQAILDSSEGGGRFKIADISNKLAESHAAGSGPIPSYQVHAALAWLKHSGIVMQHGRRGYSLASRRRFLREVKTAMAILAHEAGQENPTLGVH